VEPARQRDGVDFVLWRGRETITGVALGPDGAPLAGAAVHARGYDEEGQRLARPALSGGDGRFVLSALPRGSYALDGSYPGLPPVWIDAVASGAADVRIRFAAGASLAGRVVDARGTPVGDFELMVQSDEAPPRARAVRDPTGAFAVDGLAAGTYEVAARAPDGRTARVAGITLAEGVARRDLSLVLAAPRTLVGRVIAFKTGAPVVGAKVFVPDYADAAPTDGTGAFSVDLPPLIGGEARLWVQSVPPYLGDDFVVTLRPDGTTDAGTLALLAAEPLSAPSPGQIGVWFENRDGAARFSRVFPDLPAARAGIAAGDALLAIGTDDVRALGMTGLTTLVGGAPGSTVTLTVGPAAGGPPRTVTLTRDPREKE
jgi:hypothetical protein